MPPRVPLVPLIAMGAAAERSTRRVWAAVAALVASGVAQLVAASTLGANGLLQLVLLGAALAQFAPAGFLVSLALSGQRPGDAIGGLLMAMAGGLVAVDMRVPSAIAAGAATLADVLVVGTVIALLSGFWRRRAEDAAMCLGAIVWLLWLLGVGVAG
jgi:hypothetical protein